MRCGCCGFETEVVTLYCVRCGEPGVADDSSAEWQRRLAIVRTLIANRVWDALAGIAAIKRQVQRLKAIEQEPLVVPQNLALARQWLARELGPALSEPDLSLRHQLCETLCEWLPAGEAPELHAHFQRLRDLIPELQSGAKTAAQGSLPPAAAAAWLDSTAEQYGFTPADLRRCLFATPHYWSRLAKAVDSAAFDEAQYELFLGYGYGALAKKKFPDAKTNFESAQRLSPERPEAYVGLGAVANNQEDRPAALRLYRQALDRGTQNPRVLNDIAWFETTVLTPDKRDLDFAKSVAQLAATSAPICHILDTLAEVLSDRGELSAALRAARAAFADSPEEKYRYRIDILAGAETILNPSLGQLPAVTPVADALELESPELGRDQGPLLAPDEFADTDAPTNGKPHTTTPRANLPPASTAAQDSDEDFELTLDDSGGSDDEFELTLDDPYDPLALDDIPPYLADRDPEPVPDDIDLSHLDDEFELDLGPDPAVAEDDDFFLAPAGELGEEEEQEFELPPMEEEIALSPEPEAEPE